MATVVLVITVIPASARLKPEKAYQNEWCLSKCGQVEYVLPDRTRVDCLMWEYAIEFEFADNWAEAIGQSLYYSAMTGKMAGIVLIMESDKDDRYLKRLNKAIDSQSLPIRVWIMRGEE